MKSAAKIGVLDLQGAVAEHIEMLKSIGCDTVAVKKAEQLDGLQGLVIPGGESTTIGKLMERYGLAEEIKKRAQDGMAIFGTCAGLILLAEDIDGSSQMRLGLMGIRVKRNAFGRQVESFEADIPVPVLGDTPFRAIFIRAPYIESVKPGVEELARVDGKIVFARQGRFLVSAFHPELSSDDRVHRYFVEQVVKG